MKRILASLVVVVLAAAGLGHMEAAEAARLGGGKSFGMNRSDSVVRRQAAPSAPTAPAQNAAPTAPAPQAPAPARSGMWGMLGGLALGLGLGALFAHFGLGAEFGSLLMILALVFGAVMLFRFLARRARPAAPPLGYAGAPGPAGEPLQFEAPASNGTVAAANIPADFDVAGFLRQAKLSFGRLQAANDAGNLDDIHVFTTPEMFAEIQLQFQERGRAAQRTDVVQLDARLLDLSTEGARHVASVRFTGLIRETADGAPESFDEVWHLVKPVDGAGGWLLAGIQQLA